MIQCMRKIADFRPAPSSYSSCTKKAIRFWVGRFHGKDSRLALCQEHSKNFLAFDWQEVPLKEYMVDEIMNS